MRTYLLSFAMLAAVFGPASALAQAGTYGPLAFPLDCPPDAAATSEDGLPVAVEDVAPLAPRPLPFDVCREPNDPSCSPLAPGDAPGSAWDGVDLLRFLPPFEGTLLFVEADGRLLAHPPIAAERVHASDHARRVERPPARA